MATLLTYRAMRCLVFQRIGFWATCACLFGMTWAPLLHAANASRPTYIVPESWRDRVTALLDPGREGLLGLLPLAEIKLGSSISAQYKGPAGSLRVKVIAARLASESTRFKGKRMGLELVASTLDEPMRDKALKELWRILEARELGWSWLRVSPEEEKKKEALKREREDVFSVRRMIWLGETESAMAKLSQARLLSGNEISTSLLASQLAYEGDRPGIGRKIARRLLPRFDSPMEQMGREGLSHHPLGRRKLLGLKTTILAGLADKTPQLIEAWLRNNSSACAMEKIVESLMVVGDYSQAQHLARRITDSAPSCDGLWAQRVELARRMKDIAACRRVHDAALAKRSALVEVRSALARAELELGEPQKALHHGEIAVLESRASKKAVLTLATAALGSQVPPEIYQRWDGWLAREQSRAHRALGAISRLAADSPDRAAMLLEVNRRDLQAGASNDALEAIALCRAGRRDEADPLLAASWRQPQLTSAVLVAEAECHQSDGDHAGELRAWRAYLERGLSEPGPIEMASVHRRVMALSTEKTPATKPESRSPESLAKPPESDWQNLTFWLLLCLLCGGAFWVWKRRDGKMGS